MSCVELLVVVSETKTAYAAGFQSGVKTIRVKCFQQQNEVVLHFLQLDFVVTALIYWYHIQMAHVAC